MNLGVCNQDRPGPMTEQEEISGLKTRLICVGFGPDRIRSNWTKLDFFFLYSNLKDVVFDLLN